MLTISKRCKKTHQWILHPQAQEYAVVSSTKSKDLHCWAGCVDKFIQMFKLSDMLHIVPVGAIIGPVHSKQENGTSDRSDSIWVGNNQVDLDSYCTVYQLQCLN